MTRQARDPGSAHVELTSAHLPVEERQVHAILALAAEQRTANLIAEATRLRDQLVLADDLLDRSDVTRIRAVLRDLDTLIGGRLSLASRPEVTP